MEGDCKVPLQVSKNMILSATSTYHLNDSSFFDRSVDHMAYLNML